MPLSVRNYEAKDIRNIAFVGHSHAGKTSLADAILFDEGVTTRLGHTQDATSSFDTSPEEVQRGLSLSSHFGWVEHQGRKLNLVDTPGDPNFVLDGLTALLGVDSIVSVIDATQGVQISTQRAWNAARERHLARVIFINKLDKATRSWQHLVDDISHKLVGALVPIQVPVGMGGTFTGVVDLLSQTFLKWTSDTSGRFTTHDVDDNLKEEVHQARQRLVEAIVSTQDALMERYLQDEPIAPEVLREAFSKAVKRRQIIPILFGCVAQNMGVQPLLDLLAETLPSPVDRAELRGTDVEGKDIVLGHSPSDPFLAQVIHTTYDPHVGQSSTLRIFSGSLPQDGIVFNADTQETERLGTPHWIRGNERVKVETVTCGDIVTAVKLKNTHTNNTLCAPGVVRKLAPMSYPKPMISCALIPKAQKDDDRIKQALIQLIEEDPSLSLSTDDLTHHMVLSGMGESHLDHAVARLRRQFNLDIETALPSIPYRETFAKTVTQIEGKHKKQSGGAGQFGVCVIDIEPLHSGQGIEFVDAIKGGAIPRTFIPSVEKGVRLRAAQGGFHGYPIVDFRITLRDGRHHSVDSKDIAFQMAGSKALKAAMQEAGLYILEPIYRLEIVVPHTCSGDVMSDLASRRGQVTGMDSTDQATVIEALAPLVEVQRYASTLGALSSGQGTYVMSFDHYQRVPDHLADKVKSLRNAKDPDADDDA